MGGSEFKYSTSGGQRCAAPPEVGGTNDVTVSNRVNLVDPDHVHVLCTCIYIMYVHVGLGGARPGRARPRRSRAEIVS